MAWRRQTQDDPRAAFSAVRRLDSSTVSVDDRADDRQTEAGPAVVPGPAFVGSSEGIERAREERRIEARTSVVDRDLDLAVPDRGFDLHPPPRWRVP